MQNETIWQPAVSGLTASHRVLALAVSPDYATDQTLLALASWNNPPDYVLHYGVFNSGDGGVSWTQVGSGLPDEPLAGLMFSPHLATDNVAYVTTRAGALYRSRDRGSSWTIVGTAPGQPAFADVVVDGAGAVFVASDAGVWRYKTSQFDIVINGGFETRDAWVLPVTPKTARYSDTVVYDGRQAMQIGSVGGANVPAYSSAWQEVKIPAGTKTAMLAFYTYAVSGDGDIAAESAVLAPNSPAALSETAVAAAGDAQYALIRDPGSNTVLETLFWEQSNGQTWQSRSYDLSAYAGQTMRLHFGVYNDGSDGHTGLIVDNVALLVGTEISRSYAVYLPVVQSP